MKSASDDILAGSPPQPKLRNASAPPPAMPKPSPGASSAAMSMMGASPAQELIEDMAEIEKRVKNISKHVPTMMQIAQPFIQQMRDAGMAGVANLAQGGPGNVDLMGAGAAPPPGMGAPPMGGAPPPGGGGAGPPIMPMPPM